MDVMTVGNVDQELVEATRWYFGQAAKGAAGMEEVYVPGFVNVRIDRAGGRLVIDRAEMLLFFERAHASGGMPPGGEILIASAQIEGDLGFVLFTRKKRRLDAAADGRMETVSYTFVWKRDGGNWRLLREFSAHEYLPAHSPAA
jgi:hypothetical protein